MADERIVAQDTFEQSIKDILTVLVNSTYDWQEYTDTEISDILEITNEQAMQLTKILNDQVVANNKLWSSSKTDAEIKNALIESNKYADELIGKISSISLEYVTTLPTSDIKSNVIYILQGTPNTLNVFNESTSSFVSVGDLNLDLSGYYTSTQVDNLLANKADDNTVVHADDVVQDLTTTSGTTVLSSAGLQTELDKKANDDEVVKKTDIVTTIDSTSTDTKVPSAKAVNDIVKSIYKRKLIGSVDLNDVLDEGIYYMEQQCTNSPILFGYLNVYRYHESSTSFVLQVVFDYAAGISKNVCFRTKSNDVWSDWKKFATSDELIDKGTVYNRDLNNIEKNGLYMCTGGNDAECVTGKHYPLEDNGYVQNIKYPADGYSMQTFVHNGVWGGEISMFIRRKTSGTWTEWQKMCNTTISDVVVKKDIPLPTTCSGGRIAYVIKNGMCHLSLCGLTITGDTTINIPRYMNYILEYICNAHGEIIGYISGGEDEGDVLTINANEKTAIHDIYCSIVYPIDPSWKPTT